MWSLTILLLSGAVIALTATTIFPEATSPQTITQTTPDNERVREPILRPLNNTPTRIPLS